MCPSQALATLPPLFTFFSRIKKQHPKEKDGSTDFVSFTTRLHTILFGACARPPVPVCRCAPPPAPPPPQLLCGGVDVPPALAVPLEKRGTAVSIRDILEQFADYFNAAEQHVRVTHTLT